MAGLVEANTGWRGSPWRIALWGAAALLLLLPAVAMQFTDEVKWTAADFVFAGALIGGVGLAFELAVRMTPDPFYRTGVAAALAAAFLIMWANGAVGMIGSEGNPFNLLFYGVIALALAGAVAARFRPAGMARAMGLAAAAHALTAIIGLFADLRGGMVSTAFAGLWLLSAWLFRRAARA
ncbi:MAG TPA: hypothetical protein VK614_14010 [Allosphingosinicella sp.]|nr:hypothetical protein [Allosphingosinicella sp.]